MLPLRLAQSIAHEHVERPRRSCHQALLMALLIGLRLKKKHDDLTVPSIERVARRDDLTNSRILCRRGAIAAEFNSTNAFAPSANE